MLANLTDVGESTDGNKEIVLWNAEEEIDEVDGKGEKEGGEVGAGGEETGERGMEQAGNDLSESVKVQVCVDGLTFLLTRRLLFW